MHFTYTSPEVRARAFPYCCTGTQAVVHHLLAWLHQTNCHSQNSIQILHHSSLDMNCPAPCCPQHAESDRPLKCCAKASLYVASSCTAAGRCPFMLLYNNTWQEGDKYLLPHSEIKRQHETMTGGQRERRRGRERIYVSCHSSTGIPPWWTAQKKTHRGKNPWFMAEVVLCALIRSSAVFTMVLLASDSLTAAWHIWVVDDTCRKESWKHQHNEITHMT